MLTMEAAEDFHMEAQEAEEEEDLPQEDTLATMHMEHLQEVEDHHSEDFPALGPLHHLLHHLHLEVLISACGPSMWTPRLSA